jgi:peptidoglycan/LPS O-acetylase OafA/YrhL
VKREHALDIVRGMLLLYIVFIIHGLFWLNLLPQWASSLLLFEMPAIFIVSGYAYCFYENALDGHSNAMSAQTYLLFLGMRLTRILVPYAVYALTCMTALYLLSVLGKGHDYIASELIVAWMNPFNYGQNFSVGRLNSHLWFIPIFLIVIVAMPLVTRFRPFKNPNLLVLVVGGAIGEYAISKVHFPGEDIIKQAVFYLAFSLLGYYMARTGEYFRKANYGLVASSAVVLLSLIVLVNGDFHSMNMQVNKFPPNHKFFLFACLWVSLFLFVSSRVPWFVEKFKRYGEGIWLRPFITAGYSIYLWQGVGYTVAGEVGRMIHLPILAVWLLALGLSVGLGLLAAPVERIKLNLRRTNQTVNAM